MVNEENEERQKNENIIRNSFSMCVRVCVCVSLYV